MKINFIWDGHPIDPYDAVSVETDIRYEIQENYSDLMPQSTTIYLFNNIKKAIISGLVVASDGRKLIRIYSYPFEQNKTVYEPITENLK